MAQLRYYLVQATEQGCEDLYAWIIEGRGWLG